MEPDGLDPSIFEGLADLIPAATGGAEVVEQELISSSNAVPADALQSLMPITEQSAALSPDSVSSPGQSSASSAGELSPVEELLVLIDWKNSERSGVKRTRGPSEKAHEKHVQNEKKRREDLTLAIEEINSLIPATPAAATVPAAAAKRTKVTTLQDAAEYLKRLQDVALQLLQENKRLAATLQDQPAIPAVPARSRPALHGQEVVRLFIFTAFFVWAFVGIPTPWSDPAASIAFSSRSILNVNADDVTHKCVIAGQFLRDYLARFLSGVAVFVVVWVCTLLTDMPRVSEEEAKRASELLSDAKNLMERDSNYVVAHAKFTEAMAALHRPLPTSKVGTVMFFSVQLVRAVLNCLLVNLWLERMLVYIVGRTEVTLIDARAYMLAARLGRSTETPRVSAPLFFGCVLSCASFMNIGNADQTSRDEFGIGVITFLSDAPRTKRRVVLMLSIAIMAIAEAQLHVNWQAPDLSNLQTETGATGGVLTEWSVIRMVAEPIHSGQFQEAFRKLMGMLKTAKGDSLAKVLGSAGMMSFCMRRYHAAFLLMTSAVRTSGTALTGMKVRYISASILLTLHKMGLRKQAQLLLPHLENSYLAVPNARTNLQPTERIFFLTCKVALADDWPSVVAHTRELLSIVDALGIQRNFKIPYTLEIALERLFEALETVNASEGKAKRDAATTYLLHQRGEIKEMAESIITHLSRATYWAAFVHPIVERARGRHALISGDRNTAAYHLNRSLLDAKRWNMEAEHEETKELMDKVNIAVIVEGDREISSWCRRKGSASGPKPEPVTELQSIVSV